MPLENRIFSCDGCGHQQQETRFGTGVPDWSKVDGIGACTPKHGQPLEPRHMEVYLCPTCKVMVAKFIQQIQKSNGVKT